MSTDEENQGENDAGARNAMNWVERLRAIQLTEMQKKGAIIGLAFLLTLAAPFLLRPDNASSASDAGPADTLVIVTPHNETIRQEFAIAFEDYMRREKGRKVHIDWRTPGGTGEISKILQQEFRYAFESYWHRNRKEPWSDAIGQAFSNRKLRLPDPKEAHSETEVARRIFLKSDVGIGIDLFFGGGVYDFDKAADSGYLVSKEGQGLKAIRKANPDWFGSEIIPFEVAGEFFYDKDLRWCGTCLSSFGFCYNVDTLKRIGIKDPPAQWEDLAKPEYFGLIALADPTKSGSVSKAFEMLIQQQMRIQMNAIPVDTEEDQRARAEVRALNKGWINGLRLIQKISANARYFTDNAAKIPNDVARGNAAAGMCIDFYGRTFNERLRKANGKSRVQYVTPVGGSSVSVDPIGLVRGAPNPKLATEFMRWVLSQEGQKLWNYKVGAPGGPKRQSLRRLPIRKDIYVEEYLKFMTDADEMPYEKVNQFVYEPKWTASLFNPLRLVLRVMVLEPHPELKEAWKEIIAHDMPIKALDAFHDLSLVSYPKVQREIAQTMSSRGGISTSMMAGRFSNMLRRGYETAAERARLRQ